MHLAAQGDHCSVVSFLLEGYVPPPPGPDADEVPVGCRIHPQVGAQGCGVLGYVRVGCLGCWYAGAGVQGRG